MTWKEFWTWFTTVPEAKVEPEKPYWVPLVENNIARIVESLGEGEIPSTEEEARLLYLRWCEKSDVPATPTQKLEANCVVTPRPEMNERMGVWQTPSMSLVSQCKYGKKLWVYNVSRVDHKFGHPKAGQRHDSRQYDAEAILDVDELPRSCHGNQLQHRHGRDVHLPDCWGVLRKRPDQPRQCT